MSIWDEQDDVEVREPIQPKKDCRVKIVFAEPADWTVKEHVPEHAGEVYKAAKVRVEIVDTAVTTEHEGAVPIKQFDTQFNVQRYPYAKENKETGQLEVQWLHRNTLYSLEEALGFDPVFKDEYGNDVEPHVTKTGRKVAPRKQGTKRLVNPDFASAYFHPNGTVNPNEWIDKELHADIGLEESEQYGNRNTLLRFKQAPTE